MTPETRAEYLRIDRDEIPLPSAAAVKRHAPVSLLLNGIHYARRIVHCSRETCRMMAVRRIVTAGDASAPMIRDTCAACGLTVEYPLPEDGKM